MKRLLIVVDYQHDFVDGALGFPGAEDIDARIAAKIDEYHANGDIVVFTMDTHDIRYPSTLEGKNLPTPHCIEGTPGWHLYGKTAEAYMDRDLMFRKPSFGSVRLFEYLRQANTVATEMGKVPYESIEIVGLVSNICVISNAVLAKTACPDVPIAVDASCTASFDDALNTETLDVLQGLQIDVANR